MMKPDFKQMSRQDLKKYVLSHPSDNEALRELVLNRRNPNAKIFPPEFDNFHEVIESALKTKSVVEVERDSEAQPPLADRP